VRDPLGHGSRIAAVAALTTCGVFDEILRRPTSAAELAGRLLLDEGALSRSLELARALGMLRESAGVYRANEDDPARLEGTLLLMRTFTDHLRTGATLTCDTEGRGQLYSYATPALATMFRASAERLAEALESLPCGGILDVGAGSGVWSLAMAARRPGAVVSALDLEPVLDRFREAVGDTPHETIAGDYHEVDLESRWDRVVLANVVHLEAEPLARSLLARAASWRRPGGRVIVVDSIFRDEASELELASYELHLALRVEGGRVYEVGTIAGWARDIGLEVESSLILDRSAGTGALVLR
jgi:SAM-dependent methyltransferase